VDISFDKLIELQHIDSDIAATQTLLDALPGKIEAIAQQIRDTAEIVAKAKEKMAANQKKRRDLEGEVKSIREHAGKYKRQLNDVKTNKEYASLLKEIEDADRRIARIEEDILNEMIAADDIEKEIKTAQKKQVEEEGKLQVDRADVLRRQKEIEGAKAVLEKARAELLPRIPPDQFAVYQRIAKKTSGVALSPIKDDFCSLCQMRVRPQVLDELWAMNEVLTCEACGRILYHEKPPAEAEPGMPVDDPNRKDDSGPPE